VMADEALTESHTAIRSRARRRIARSRAATESEGGAHNSII
jgi:hypothetical protein